MIRVDSSIQAHTILGQGGVRFHILVFFSSLYTKTLSQYNNYKGGGGADVPLLKPSRSSSKDRVTALIFGMAVAFLKFMKDL